MFDFYKEKYLVSWCELCDRVIIKCQECKNSSCNGGGCDKCNNDFEQFNKICGHVKDYLTEDEIKVYDKIRAIKKHMLNEIGCGHLAKLDFEKLKEEEKLSQNDIEIFGL